MALGALMGQTSQGIPSGCIVMWSGVANAIPSGWLLCDGTNNTPDLRGRFVVGAGGSYGVGNTGGSEQVTLTTAQMPSHSHNFDSSGLEIEEGGEHEHTTYLGNIYYDGSGGNSTSLLNPQAYNTFRIGGGAHTHTITGSASISSTGSSQPHENRPPYYALCYIMKS